MPRNEISRRWSASLKVSLGPLQFQRTCVEEYVETPLIRPTFKARVQALIQQALSEGCPRQELDNILRQLTPGDSHVDS